MRMCVCEDTKSFRDWRAKWQLFRALLPLFLAPLAVHKEGRGMQLARSRRCFEMDEILLPLSTPLS